MDPFEDPLKDLDPCGPLGCEAETGEMNSRGILEEGDDDSKQRGEV